MVWMKSVVCFLRTALFAVQYITLALRCYDNTPE